jgi:hypothetical protein
MVLLVVVVTCSKGFWRGTLAERERERDVFHTVRECCCAPSGEGEQHWQSVIQRVCKLSHALRRDLPAVGRARQRGQTPPRDGLVQSG